MKRFRDLGLGPRVAILLGALILITLAGGGATIWHAVRTHELFLTVIDDYVTDLQAALELETALASQKGFATYYFVDNDPRWLEQLGKYRQSFKDWLDRARAQDRTNDGRKDLDRIEAEFNRYVESKDKVIALYRAGKREEGARLHTEVRGQYEVVSGRCKEYKELQVENIARAREVSRREAGRITLLASAALAVVMGLSALLALVLFRQILIPIRILAREAASAPGAAPGLDEVGLLRESVHGLMEDRDLTRTELERSRARLMDSEKMAVVGRLAAGVAHSIRNPMTSIKMRLFSLERGLDLSTPQKDDFEVVSEEMRRLENIVTNFLEFSRPHKLRMQKVNVSDIVDGTLDLLHHRLQAHEVMVKKVRRQPLPAVDADPELIKEVMVNLVVNACEAMGQGGRITITEEEAVTDGIGRVVMVRVADTGPGIPDGVREKILEPFYTTKEEGTGLGLSIVFRILEEHGGRLELSSSVEGAVFTFTLPVRE